MSDTMLSVEVATVFRGGGRRWFTKKAAARAVARQIIRARCYCDAGDEITPGDTCHFHEDPDHYEALVGRLARFVLRAVSPEAPHA